MRFTFQGDERREEAECESETTSGSYKKRQRLRILQQQISLRVQSTETSESWRMENFFARSLLRIHSFEKRSLRMSRRIRWFTSFVSSLSLLQLSLSRALESQPSSSTGKQFDSFTSSCKRASEKSVL